MMEVNFLELKVDDEITIRTKSSEYRFHVTNPALYRGTLSGGVLGSKHREAYFAGSRSAEVALDSTTMRIGTSASFLVRGGRALKQLTTSVVIELRHLSNLTLRPEYCASEAITIELKP